jgi:hypothetical protein
MQGAGMQVRGGMTRKRKGKGSVMKNVDLIIFSFVIAVALAPQANAVPAITVNGIVTAELAPPAGSHKTDTESGTPLARTTVTVADQLSGVWAYSSTADITVPKLAILGSIDNSAGGALSGPFGGEMPLMRVNAELRDTINITAPSAAPYLVTAELDIDGTLQVGGGDGTVNAVITMDPVDRLAISQFRTYDTNVTVVDDKLPISFQFVGDAQFDLSSSLFFFVNHVDAGAKVRADFSNTAIINLTVTTLAGDVIPNVVIHSDSGNFGSAPVPLPASLPLLMSALTAVGYLARAGRSALSCLRPV